MLFVKKQSHKVAVSGLGGIGKTRRAASGILYYIYDGALEVGTEGDVIEPGCN